MTAQEWLKQFETPQGMEFVAKNGCVYDDLTDYVQCDMFGFCGCGSPTLSFQFILDGLKFIQWQLDYYRNNQKADYNIVKEKRKEVFGNENIAYFFFYWADKQGFTEHGGSVPGWLTKEGKTMINILEHIIEEENKNQ